MNKFPDHIDIRNKNPIIQPYKKNFEEYNNERILKLLRNEIYDHIISRKDENDYFDIDIFFRKNNYYYKENFANILKIVLDEISNLGWKTQLSFGDSAVFIYSTEEKPSSCW